MREVVREFISKEQIAEKVAEMGAAIDRDYEGQDLHLICVLKGSVVIMADLARAIKKCNVFMHFMDVSSYGSSTESSGNIKILMDIDEPIKDKNVIIVEDIIDSGRTLSVLKDMLQARGPKSLKIATLLNKPDRRVSEVEVEYQGFSIPDEFVVGYGLDYAQKYRNLDYIGKISFEE